MSSYCDQEGKPQTYSRKEKSLGLLCLNFLNHYTQEKVDSISLDEAACRLGVERRRIYDIVNVLESVGVLVRKAKNRYTWKGYEGIPKFLEKLRETALEGDVLNGVKNLADLSEIKMNNVRVCVNSDDDEEENSSNENRPPLENVKRQTTKHGLNKSSPVSVFGEASKSKADCRREKSLGLLTQKFVQLFLVTQAQIVSLEDAARLLLGECKESAKLKTKVRRLYDIANILSSLNLIEKTHSAENRKPAFKWLGAKDNAKYPSETPSRKRQFGTVLSSNTSTTAAPKTKRPRPLNRDHVEAPAKNRTTLKPLQPRSSDLNAGGAIYNPVALYPRERQGSSVPVPVPNVAVSAPRVPTSLTLGTSGGWREWSTTDSHRASEQTEKKASGSVSASETRSSQCLEDSSFNRRGSSPKGSAAAFSFGPFCPFRLQQQCLATISSSSQSSDRGNDQSDESKDGECFSQEQARTTPFPLHYQNEALDHMFLHYMNAWKSWYLQVATSATANATSTVQSPAPCAQEPCDSSTEDI
ncbi:uncharacterized protein LOC131053739 isoform X1 [Cryptomeria japonica]|uniref:uncharacterized protein LOC131053739 isoform X1 n=1 Tax=Cryptomeria japonica TaxID=3369 RepID=UPI0027DA9C48|nr:uncharacterized protein LOC131053739 isoform X1 [Cryptomeria japonica]